MAPLKHNPLGFIFINNEDPELFFKETLQIKTQNVIQITAED